MRKFFPLIFVLAVGLASVLMAQDSAQDRAQSANVAGKWQLSWQGRDGARQATLQLQQDGSTLTGTLDGDRGSVPVTGTINGSSVSFSTQSQGGHRSVSMAYTGAVDGDKMTGTFQPQGGQVHGGMGGGHRGNGGEQSRSWTATRQSGNSNGPGAAGNNSSDNPQLGF